MLAGKNILLGVTGSIAAYKSALLARLLVKAGANVKVVMTEAAQAFITPLTLSTLTNHPVYTDFVADNKSGTWNNHVDLGLWADLMVIAPATANVLAQSAHGLCQNLLNAVYLSARCKVMFCPAMDLDMYAHPSTQQNLKQLANFGNLILEAKNGQLASGLTGQGRMQEPEEIYQAIQDFFDSGNTFLQGKKVLVTAGPTFEPIDPVRFIGNHSSGKMGVAIADAALAAGAEVTLIHGPIALDLREKQYSIISVTTAQDMLNAVQNAVAKTDVLIMSAAVADYRPKSVAKEKIKKSETEFQITLEKNPDILKTLAPFKKERQVFVGFALETENELQNGLQKLKGKNLDFLVLNSLKDEGAGFGVDTNKVKFLHRDGQIETFDLKSKYQVAQDIVEALKSYLVF